MKKSVFSICTLALWSLMVACIPLQSFGEERKRWIPDYASMQFAGSIGAASVGTGWIYGRQHWQTEVLLGVIPKEYEHPAMLSFTLKQQYTPWMKDFGNGKFSFQPLQCGLFLNTVANQHFWTVGPERYPKGYYGFSTKLRFHIFLGQSVSYRLPEKFRGGRAVSFYYELSTCDLYIVSAATNRWLSPKDYLSLALGLRWYF